MCIVSYRNTINIIIQLGLDKNIRQDICTNNEKVRVYRIPLSYPSNGKDSVSRLPINQNRKPNSIYAKHNGFSNVRRETQG